MQTLFYACFGIGVGYAVISFLMGGLLGVMNIDADIDIDIGDFSADADVDIGDFGGGSPSPIKPVVIAVFLTLFGGAGIIMLNPLGVLTAVSLAGLCGLAGAFLFYRFVIVPLYKMQNTSAVEMRSLIGTRAKVTEYIPQGKFGKITYYANGNTYSAPAKSDGGSAIDRLADVEIVRIERNTFFVASSDGRSAGNA